MPIRSDTITDDEVMVVAKAFASAIALCDGGKLITNEEWESAQTKVEFEEIKMVMRECIAALDTYRQSIPNIVIFTQ